MKSLKKLFVLVAFGVFIFTSCEKDPDWDQSDNKYVVKTEYDNKADFNKFGTYFVNDTVYVIGSNSDKKIERWNYKESARARGMIDNVIKNMDAYGYKRVVQMADMPKPDFDLGLQVVYIQDTRYMIGTGYNSWWDYWGAWGGGWSWGWNYPPYYPYPVYYTYSVGSVIVDMIDNNGTPAQVPGEHKPRKPIVWNAYAQGELSTSNNFNQQVAEWSINQAFVQSPYLKKK